MLAPQPVLRTPRLVLRPFRDDDGPAVERLAGERSVADTTLALPHPYPAGGATTWIAGHDPGWRAGTTMVCAVTKEPEDLVGAAGLTIVPAHRRAELGYWIGRPYWNLGFATDAAHALVWYGFAHLGLNRIQALCFTRNPASARVMQKVGMTHEGRSRQLYVRWDRLEDVERYAVLRDEYRGAPWPVDLA